MHAARHQLRVHILRRFHVADLLLLRHLEEGRPGHVNVAALDEPQHLAVKEGQEQGANVLAVHVGVGEDHDLAVA